MGARREYTQSKVDIRNPIVRKILVYAQVDWVMACDIEGHARTMAGARDFAEARDCALPVVRYLLESEYMTAGWLREKKFVEWGDGPDSAYRKIESSWRELNGKSVEFGGICWLQITAKGMDAARAIGPPAF